MAFVADTHVHLYPQFDLRSALIGGNSRLRAAAEKHLPCVQTQPSEGCETDSPIVKLLCLTERSTENYFSSFSASGIADGLRVTRTNEEQSLRVGLPDGDCLFLIAGRQFVTVERLEILFLGCRELPSTALTLPEAVDWAASRKALPVFPWSLGKWIGNRGKLLCDFIERSTNPHFLLGDIFMRPAVFPVPSPMRDGLAKRVRIISGSDPLPMPGEEALIGRSVVWGNADISPEAPWASFSNILSVEKDLTPGDDASAQVARAAVKNGGSKGTVLSLFTRSLLYRLRKSPSISIEPSNANSAGPVM